MQKCNFWKWEDELSGYVPNKEGKKPYSTSSMINDSNKEKLISISLHEIKTDLATIKYVLLAVVLVCAWMVSRV
jgi:hypothetical protein